MSLPRRFIGAAVLSLTLGTLALAGTTVGSGQRASESRDLADFEAIELAGSMKLVVRQGPRNALHLQADDNVLPLIEASVETRDHKPTLRLRLRKGETLRRAGDIVITVDALRLTSLAVAGNADVEVAAFRTPELKLAIAGSSDMVVRGLAADRLRASIAGSGDLKVDGMAKVVKLSIAGSGDADLAGLGADEVEVSIAGSGDASVTANRSLGVSIAGSGDVRHAGAATDIKSSIVGSGTLHRR